MKSSRNHKLFNRLTRHVGEFWSRSVGLPKSCVVALSGGVDSTLLLEVVTKLGLEHDFSVRAVHVDHGTQSEQAIIENNLRRLCQQNSISLTILRTALLNLTSNFEAKAREQRLSLLENNLEQDEIIVFGHHIDDSYEWSLLQSLRSARTVPALGIPLINGKRVRPFMCLTRAQIFWMHKSLNLWSFDDASNSNEKFARNHLRRVINQEFAPRYPNYLKHYVARSNHLAKQLGVSVFTQEKFEQDSSEGVRVLFSSDPRQQEEELVSMHAELSNVARSSVRREIIKLAQAFHSGRRGPHQLPGEVKAWSFAGSIMFTNQIGEERLKNSWDVGAHIPDACPLSQIKPCILIVVWNPPKWLRKIGLKSHPLITNLKKFDVVLLPWSRMVKIKSRKNLKLSWKTLNI